MARMMVRGRLNHCAICRPRCRPSSISRACSVGVRCARISRTSGDWNGNHVDQVMPLRGMITRAIQNQRLETAHAPKLAKKMMSSGLSTRGATKERPPDSSIDRIESFLVQRAIRSGVVNREPICGTNQSPTSWPVIPIVRKTIMTPRLIKHFHAWTTQD